MHKAHTMMGSLPEPFHVLVPAIGAALVDVLRVAALRVGTRAAS